MFKLGCVERGTAEQGRFSITESCRSLLPISKKLYIHSVGQYLGVPLIIIIMGASNAVQVASNALSSV